MPTEYKSVNCKKLGKAHALPSKICSEGTRLQPKFPRSARLTTAKDFDQVFAQAGKLASQYLMVLYKSSQLANARLGVILTRRSLKRAVDRNRIRRVIRESFRIRQDDLVGLDIVVLMRSKWSTACKITKAKQLTKKMLRDDIDNLWDSLIASYKVS